MRYFLFALMVIVTSFSFEVYAKGAKVCQSEEDEIDDCINNSDESCMTFDHVGDCLERTSNSGQRELGIILPQTKEDAYIFVFAWDCYGGSVVDTVALPKEGNIESLQYYWPKEFPFISISSPIECGSVREILFVKVPNMSPYYHFYAKPEWCSEEDTFVWSEVSEAEDEVGLFCL